MVSAEQGLCSEGSGKMEIMLTFPRYVITDPKKATGRLSEGRDGPLSGTMRAEDVTTCHELLSVKECSLQTVLRGGLSSLSLHGHHAASRAPQVSRRPLFIHKGYRVPEKQ